MKDNFSSQSENYARFRPNYPSAFFDYLYSILAEYNCAWDCGTGNGQVAVQLAKKFRRVFATDISRAQIDNAIQEANIDYSIQPAEKTNFDSKIFDLIMVAQAIHWFDFEKFYEEVRRTAKDNAIICVLGYGRVEVTDRVDSIISDFYSNIIGPYWDEERKFIDDSYNTIPFTFEEIKAPKFSNTQHWTFDHLIGYLNTWSAVKHFVSKNGVNPIDGLRLEIEQAWGSEKTRTVAFPLFSRVGMM